jgi:signal peptidase I
MKTKIITEINSGCLLSRLTQNKPGPDKTFFCAHSGPSMNPTLSAQDLLEIKPYSGKRPKPGDVIFFKPPHDDYYVVHRIIRICSRGIQTRGDNNNHTDPWFLKPEDACGQVIAAHRGDASRKISSGFMGRLTGLFCQLRRKTQALLINILRPVYRFLNSSDALRRLMPLRLSPLVVTFTSKNHSSIRLLLGKTIIGTYDHALQQWQIEHPYRILLNESLLPKPR